MRAALARAVVTLAAESLAGRRRGWGLAMRAELDAAVEDGRPLGFAFGCLLAAWRDLPGEREGRFALASHALALCLVLPAAAVALLGALLGYPYLALGKAGLRGFLAGRSEQVPLLNAGDWAIAPPLTLLVLGLALGQLVLAWFVLERAWTRVAAAARFNAAAMATLVVVMAVLAFDMTPALLPAAGLVTETLAVLALARWHEQLSGAGWAEEPGG